MNVQGTINSTSLSAGSLSVLNNSSANIFIISSSVFINKANPTIIDRNFILIGDSGSTTFDNGYFGQTEQTNSFFEITATSSFNEVNAIILNAFSSVETFNTIKLTSIPLESSSIVIFKITKDINNYSDGTAESLQTKDINNTSNISAEIIENINIVSETKFNLLLPITSTSDGIGSSLQIKSIDNETYFENSIIRKINVYEEVETFNSLFIESIEPYSNLDYRFFRRIDSFESVDVWNSFLLPTEVFSESEAKFNFIKEINSTSNIYEDFLKFKIENNSSVDIYNSIKPLEIENTSSIEQLATIIYSVIINSKLEKDIKIEKEVFRTIITEATFEKEITKAIDLFHEINSNINLADNIVITKLYSKTINSSFYEDATITKILDLFHEINSYLNASIIPTKDIISDFQILKLYSDIKISKNIDSRIKSYFFNVGDILITDNVPLREGSVFVYSNSNDFTSLQNDIEDYIFIENTLLIKYDNKLNIFNSNDKFFVKKQEIDFSEIILHSFVLNNKAYLLTGSEGNYKITEIMENRTTKKVHHSNSIKSYFNYAIDDMKVVDDSIFLINNQNNLAYVINIRTEKHDLIDINEFFNNDYNTLNSMVAYDIEKFNDRYLVSTPGVINTTNGTEGGIITVFDKHELVSEK